MSRRVLFLSASVGVGHTAAAAAVSEVLRRRDPHIDCQIVDSYKYAASIFSRVVADGYIGMVKTIPQMYRYIYDRAEKATNVGAFKKWVNQFTAENLRTLVEKTAPSVIVCTHAFPCGVMSEYKRQFDDGPPVVGIVTDFVVHPFWIYRNIDAYAVATSEMRAALVARGVERARIVTSGIPVDPRFGASPEPRLALRERLELPLDRPVVLLMAGGVGIGPLEAMMRALDRVNTPLAAAVIVGKNPRLEKRVLEAAQRTEYPLRVLGFVDNVFDYMHACDLLLTKPGGLTSSEALAAEIPMVLVKPLPGQEERNTRYLVERRAAIRVRSERHLARAVERCLLEPESLGVLRESIRSVRKPDAAEEVATLVEAVMNRRDATRNAFELEKV